MKVFGISDVRKNKFINDLDRTLALGNVDILPECLSVQESQTYPIKHIRLMN